MLVTIAGTRGYLTHAHSGTENKLNDEWWCFSFSFFAVFVTVFCKFKFKSHFSERKAQTVASKDQLIA